MHNCTFNATMIAVFPQCKQCICDGQMINMTEQQKWHMTFLSFGSHQQAEQCKFSTS